jgi:hypothetical protein
MFRIGYTKVSTTAMTCYENSHIPVLTTSPPLPSLSILVETLNNTRDIYGFIKQVRAAYGAQVKPIL